MDDTAQNPQTQQNQQNTQVSPVQSVVGQTPPAVPQPSVAQTPGMPSPSRNPEQGPVGSGLPSREAASVGDPEAVTTATDDQAAIPDEAADAGTMQSEAVDVRLQESHPQVEVAKELQEAGVEQGEDAKPEQLPEEQITKPDDKAAQPDTQASASGVSLSSSPVQLQEVKRKNGIRNSIKWLATALLRQLKRMAIKPEDQKSTW